jgi:hypothetical protein
MAIKFNGNLDMIFGDIYKKFQEKIIPDVIEQLQAVCTEIVAEARQLDTYQDQTGNLRSSIGYIIYHDGKKVGESFIAFPGQNEESDGGKTGISTGEKIAHEAIQKWAGTGIIAVIVAGMDYALLVESKGYDVITGPTSKLKQMLEARLQDIKDVYK